MCKTCRGEVFLLEDYPHCYCCGKRMKSSTLCITCSIYGAKFDAIRSVFVYNSYVASFIRRIKFRDETFLARIIAEAMIKHFTDDLEKCDFIVPVPIHRIRLAKRKYNQSGLVAIQLAKLTNVKVRFDVLRKIKNTPSQIGLSIHQRRKNLQGAFSIRNHHVIEKAFIILLDDVVTTGTTVSRCAEALSRYNPRKIVVLSIARSILY